MGGYRRFKAWVNNLKIVNDCAERGVTLIEDFVDSVRNERGRQDTMLAVSNERKAGSDISKKALAARYKQR